MQLQPGGAVLEARQQAMSAAVCPNPGAGAPKKQGLTSFQDVKF